MIAKYPKRILPVTSPRSGKILVLLALLIPTFCGIAGLVIDGGLLMLESRHVQNVADAAATAAATELRLGNGAAAAIAAGENEVLVVNGLSGATVTVHVPPTSGPYAGSSRYAEVLVQRPIDTHFMHVLNGRRTETVAARSVAGVEDATEDAAIIILDPDPAQFSTAPIPLALALNMSSLVAGLEVLGIGRTDVQGAVLVNNQWGGVDENNETVGETNGMRHAVSCTPVLPLMKLFTTDLRVVGGVDAAANYGNVQAGEPSPLKANRLPVPDPLKNLPAPTLTADPVNVIATNFGGRTVVGLPLVTTTLNPGVYDYINIVSGTVKFNPGIYIIRGEDPTTHYGLRILAGQVNATGVMFYLTNSAAYTPASGAPDASDGETAPGVPASATLNPSAVIDIGLLGSSYTPLDSPGSPFNGMMFYQRRHDRRPIVIIQENLIGGGTLQGTVYAKWGHVVLAGLGNYDARFAVGTMRLVAVLNMNINPTTPFPPATDVFLVE